MVMKNISVKAKPLIKKLSKGYELKLIEMKPKNGNISWRVIVVDYNKLKDGDLVALFDKPLKRCDFDAVVQGNEIRLNNNGVQATYLEWRTAVEKLIGVKITWQPMGREMFRLFI